MSLVTGTARTGEAAAVAEAPLLDGRVAIIGTLAICTFYVGVRIYEQIFGWYAGLNSFAPEFTTYWMTILYIEEPVELIVSSLDLNPRLQTGRGFSRFFVHRLTP